MAIGRGLNNIGECLFQEFAEIFSKKGYEEFDILKQIPNIIKTDILEYFEYHIMDFAVNGDGEADSFFMLRTKELYDNNPNPTYISEYISIVGQLFLAGYIEFGMCGLQDKEENLLANQGVDKYQAWIHFRDNFFYTGAYEIGITDLEEKYPNMSDDDYVYSNWDTPQYWDRYRFWVMTTPKGEKYFNEILAPRFYNKYKDLSVEIDSEGNIIRWIGEIKR